MNLTDMETCYKLFKAELIRRWHLQGKAFWL